MDSFVELPALKLTNLTKRYAGAAVDALHDLSLQVDSGQVFGFLGPNGAGKSTTINMLVNLLQPTNGQIEILGKDSAKDGLQIRQRVGFLTGDMALDEVLTGRQQLEYIGHLRGTFDKKQVQQLAARLDCNLDRKIKTLSRGNRQKIGLIAALMHRPPLLIFDEPTSGLDPLVQIEFNKIILEHKKTGGTTFISSHVLSEVQELCDRVAIIRAGHLIVDKPLTDIVSDAPKHVRLATKSLDAAMALKKIRGVSDFKTNGGITFRFKGDLNQLTKALAKLPLQSLSITDTDLEEIFRKYYEIGHGGNHA